MNLKYKIKQLHKDFEEVTFIRCYNDIDVYSIGRNEYYLIFKNGILDVVLHCIFEDEFDVLTPEEFLEMEVI